MEVNLYLLKKMKKMTESLMMRYYIVPLHFAYLIYLDDCRFFVPHGTQQRLLWRQ